MTSGFLPFTDAAPYTPPTPPDLSRASLIIVDTETTGLRWMERDRPVGSAVQGFDAQGVEVVPPTYLPFAHRGGQNLDEGTVRRWATRELRGKLLVGHNLRFDLHMLRAWGVDLRDQDNTFHDTQILAALLDDHRRRFSLKVLADEEGLDPKIDLNPVMIADLPAGAVAAYAEHDVRLTGSLFHRYTPRLVAEAQQAVMDLEGAVIPATVEMEANGVPLDIERLDAMTRELEALEREYLWAVVQESGRALSPDSNADWAWLFRRQGLTPGVTETGKPSFTAAVVAPAAAQDPLVRALFRAGKIRDLLAKFLRPWASMQVNGVLYPSLHQLMSDDGGTVSGRYACSKPNLQQVLNRDKWNAAYGWLPDHLYLRLLFRSPDPQLLWVSSDAKAIEMRLFAELSRAERLIQAYEADADMDPHALVQSWIRQYRPHVSRTEAKQGSFSKLYGSGIVTFADTLGVSPDEAQIVMDAYDAAFPEAKTLFRLAMTTAERRGHVRTPLGRRTRFPRDAQGRRTRVHKALNGVIQGWAADLNKLAIRDTYQRRRDLGFRMTMTVHDSNEGLASRDAIAALDAHMNLQRWPTRVPIRWDTKSGPSWGEVT